VLPASGPAELSWCHIHRQEQLIALCGDVCSPQIKEMSRLEDYFFLAFFFFVAFFAFFAFFAMSLSIRKE
jgi:bacteriorhodopsin